MFLYHCVQAGLDMAIVNSEQMQRYTSIPQEERKLAEDLSSGTGATTRWPPLRSPFPGEGAQGLLWRSASSLPLDQRLALAIIEGTREGLANDLDEALQGPDSPGPSSTDP